MPAIAPPIPPVVCGKQLKPLSADHYFLMTRFNLTFVSDEDRRATPGELLIAVLICSMDCNDFVAFASSNNFKKNTEAWGRRIGFLPPKFWHWSWRPDLNNTEALSWICRKIWPVRFDEADFEYLAGETEKFWLYVLEGTNFLIKAKEAANA